MNDKLKLLSTDEKQDGPTSKNTSNGEKLALQAKFERLWLTDPQQFDPMRNTMEKQRIKRTLDLLLKYTNLNKKSLVDLGCGFGYLSQKASEKGAFVDAVDISKNALKILDTKKIENIHTIQAYVPKTLLQDDHYDIVVSTELIGFLPQNEDRLYFAELARLVKSDGYVLCSTSLDIKTEGALQRFASLAETEFQIIEWSFSYHALFIKINNFFKSPHRFYKASKNSDYKNEEMSTKSSFAKKWFAINSCQPLSSFWGLVSYLIAPIVYIFKEKPKVLQFIEKICQFVSQDSGISHVTFIAKRHPVWQPTKEELEAINPKHKKQVWE